ncbi:protein phosphatase 2C [Strigomonas culicis]|uniref:Protein phosphatase 2C n=1 Tax=Strigomonas culicis TaxID=28005 RepID=S9WMJ8_9TRYP|nr:protein phosphatase 2C [Strigomonas culicis]|eukprot:EPY37160.1 protein phosphatase 2C [Strigomonas culicis]
MSTDVNILPRVLPSELRADTRSPASVCPRPPGHDLQSVGKKRTPSNPITVPYIHQMGKDMMVQKPLPLSNMVESPYGDRRLAAGPFCAADTITPLALEATYGHRIGLPAFDDVNSNGYGVPRCSSSQVGTMNDDTDNAIASAGLSPVTSTWRILEYGVTAEQGTRRTMEDQHTMLAEGIPFFAIYDGHGGKQCAEYLRDHLHSLVLRHRAVRSNPEMALREGILEADRGFLRYCKEQQTDAGCVCAVVMFLRRRIIVGNVGDAEVVLSRGGTPVVLTEKHNPHSNPTEAERILAAGGRLAGRRVGHPKLNPRAVSLAVSRALGDAIFKMDEYTGGTPSGVIAEPYTRSIEMEEQDEFIVIGCDGLWDVFTYQEVVNICRQYMKEGRTPHDITEELVNEALMRGSTDNVTVSFVSLENGNYRSDGLGHERSSFCSITNKSSDCYSFTH